MHARRSVRLVHRAAAAILIAFVAVHLGNHVVGLWGVEAHREFMDAARGIYRAPALEPLLLAAVLVQILTGFEQLRAGWGSRHDFWSRLQAISGGYLLFYLANHTLSVLAARSFYGLDSDFYLVAAVLTVPPLPLFFAPYYAFGVLAVFAHVACAVHFHVRNENRDRIAKTLIFAGAVLAPLVVAVFMGAFHEIHLPPAYRDFTAQFL